MIPYILAAFGGYLIGEGLRRPKVLADGGETYGEYAVRVRFTEADGSRHSLVYDIEASDDEAAVKAAKHRLMEEFGPFSGIEYKDAEIIRMEEVPVFGDGGQTYKFTFKTTEDYDSSKRGGYFDYDTVEVELEDPKIPFPLQPKSEEEFERIKATEKIKSVTPVRLWWDPMDIYDEPDQDDREEFDDRDEFSKGGKVDELVRDAFFAGGKSGYAAASKKDFATYEEWLKGKKIKHRGIYEAAFIAGGKSAFNMVKGRDGQTFEDFISTQGFKRGGEVKFKDKVSAISKRLKGTKVPKRLRDEYGSTYDAEESKEAAGRIAGSQLKKSQEKTQVTTKNDKFDSANAMQKPKRKNKTQPMPKSTTTKTTAKSAVKGEKIKLISAHAKKIWNKEGGEKWKDAIKRASVELKKQNKI